MTISNMGGKIRQINELPTAPTSEMNKSSLGMVAANAAVINNRNPISDGSYLIEIPTPFRRPN